MKYEFCKVTNQWIPTATTAPWMYRRAAAHEPWLRPEPHNTVPLVCVNCGIENGVPGNQFNTRELPDGLCEEVPALFACGSCRKESPISTNLFPWFAQHNFFGWRISRPGSYPGLDAATQLWRQEFAKQTDTPAAPTSPQSDASAEMDLSAVGNTASSIFSGAFNMFAGALKGAGKYLFNYACPACGQRSGKKVGERMVDQRQEVQSRHENGRTVQVVVNVFVFQYDVDCGDCGHEWTVTDFRRLKA